MFKEIKKWIVIALSFTLTVGLIWASYAAWVSLTDVGTWDTLTASLFNEVLENQRVLDARLNAALPTARVLFDWTTCWTTCSVSSHYNIDRVERVSTGKYNVYFLTDMTNTNYSILVGNVDFSDHSSQSRWITILSKDVSYVQILVEYGDWTNIDEPWVSFAVIGWNN